MNTDQDFVISPDEIFEIDTDEAAMSAIRGTARNDLVVCSVRALAEANKMTFRQFAVLSILALAKSRDNLLNELCQRSYEEGEYYEM